IPAAEYLSDTASVQQLVLGTGLAAALCGSCFGSNNLIGGYCASAQEVITKDMKKWFLLPFALLVWGPLWLLLTGA
ncbi:hypothetical protein, partial [Gemmiger formicilis]|uniref:hypothetical protein n=1 Tax=Gemmiger formicilis TaxID=745368 RepID=UPI00195E934E